MTRARDINPVRLRREELGLLLIEVAAKIERSPAMLSMVEGGFYPRAKTQRVIAGALGTAREQLFPLEFVD